MNPKKLRKRLEWLWQNRTSEPGRATDSFAAARYVPLSFGPDGPGWGVFDRLNDRFLDDAEVAALPMEQLQTATHLS